MLPQGAEIIPYELDAVNSAERTWFIALISRAPPGTSFQPKVYENYQQHSNRVSDGTTLGMVLRRMQFRIWHCCGHRQQGGAAHAVGHHTAKRRLPNNCYPGRMRRMKIIVVSQDRPLQNEAEAITRILDSGVADRVHIYESRHIQSPTPEHCLTASLADSGLYCLSTTTTSSPRNTAQEYTSTPGNPVAPADFHNTVSRSCHSPESRGEDVDYMCFLVRYSTVSPRQATKAHLHPILCVAILIHAASPLEVWSHAACGRWRRSGSEAPPSSDIYGRISLCRNLTNA